MKNLTQSLQISFRSFALILPLTLSAVLSVPFTSTPANASILEKLAHQPLNALANESSPYLKQHSRDLVQWNTWSNVALKKAVETGKPIFLSVGYSACHWCHVMQRESFNNPAVAKMLNENYIPILVDREQRPDLDETYMLATEAITGAGGWPNNVLLTPDLKPFYGGVYFPPEDLLKLLTLVNQDWIKQPQAIQLEADRIATILSGLFTRKTASKDLTEKVLAQAGQKILAKFDGFNGGIGTAPKHFNAPTIAFIMRLAQFQKNPEALEALKITLDAIAAGGVRDHLAGGFHRYAVDNNWRTPHFEKMLYDQALMSQLYVQMFQLTGEAKYAATAKSTLDYVLADLTSPQGGFYATRDADSSATKGGKSHEGIFYIWTPAQFVEALGKDDAAFITKHLGIVTQGEFAGNTIIHRNVELAGNDKVRFENVLQKLFKARNSRIKPHRDEKILAAWNGLMISAFASAATALDNKTYKDAATKSGEFVWNHMRDKNGKILRSYFEGKASVVSTLVDYAYLSNAFIDLYDLTDEPKWLKRAENLVEQMDALFMDPKIGDYFFTATKQGYARIKLRADSALPSGNAMALKVLVKLSRRTLEPKYSRRAEAVLAALSGDAVSDAQGGSTALVAAGTFLRGKSSARQFASRGRVKLTASLSPDRTKFIVKVKLAPEWHINANKPFEEQFIPTSISLKTGSDILANVKTSYPKAVSRRLGFNDKPLALYENGLTLTATLPKPATQRITGEITLQACNNEVCLLPETVKLGVTPKQ